MRCGRGRSQAHDTSLHSEPNPALAPGGLEAFVLGSEHVWDSRTEDLEQLLEQLAHPKSGSSLRKLHHEASSCPARTLLLEALPEPGCWEPSQPFSFLAGVESWPVYIRFICVYIVPRERFHSSSSSPSSVLSPRSPQRGDAPSPALPGSSSARVPKASSPCP